MIIEYGFYQASTDQYGFARRGGAQPSMRPGSNNRTNRVEDNLNYHGYVKNSYHARNQVVAGHSSNAGAFMHDVNTNSNYNNYNNVQLMNFPGNSNISRRSATRPKSSGAAYLSSNLRKKHNLPNLRNRAVERVHSSGRVKYFEAVRPATRG